MLREEINRINYATVLSLTLSSAPPSFPHRKRSGAQARHSLRGTTSNKEPTLRDTLITVPHISFAVCFSLHDEIIALLALQCLRAAIFFHFILSKLHYACSVAGLQRSSIRKKPIYVCGMPDCHKLASCCPRGNKISLPTMSGRPGRAWYTSIQLQDAVQLLCSAHSIYQMFSYKQLCIWSPSEIILS